MWVTVVAAVCFESILCVRVCVCGIGEHTAVIRQEIEPDLTFAEHRIVVADNVRASTHSWWITLQCQHCVFDCFYFVIV